MTVYQIPTVSNQMNPRPSDAPDRVAQVLPLPHLGVEDEGLVQPRRLLNPAGLRKLWGWAPAEPSHTIFWVVIGLGFVYLCYHAGKTGK